MRETGSSASDSVRTEQWRVARVGQALERFWGESERVEGRAEGIYLFRGGGGAELLESRLLIY